jgi:enolase
VKRFLGKGVLKAVENVNGEIADAIEGYRRPDQRGIDAACSTLDGTPTTRPARRQRHPRRLAGRRQGRRRDLGMPLYKYIGGPNAKVLPVPMMNIINGGAHSDAPIDFQEFMIMPKGAPTFSEALRYGAESSTR